MSSLALRGRIAELEKKKKEIATRMGAFLSGIQALIDNSIHSLTPENIRADEIASLANSLTEQRREYRETIDMIRELEREL